MKLISLKNTNGIECYSFDKGNDETINQLLNRDSLLNSFMYDINHTIRRAFNHENYSETSKRRDATNEAYPYIPNSSSTILKYYLAAYIYLTKQSKTKNIKFLDAGCGVGNVLAIIRFVSKTLYHDAKVNGIELDPALVKFGNIYCGYPEWADDSIKPIKEQDITTYDGYHKYNIVYYYCPIANSSLEKYFEEYLEDNCAVGTVIIPTLKRGCAVYDDYRFKCISVSFNDGTGSIRMFVKIKDGERRCSKIETPIKNIKRMSNLSESVRKLMIEHIKKYSK